MNFLYTTITHGSKKKQRVLSWLTGIDPAIKRKVIMRVKLTAFLILFTMLHVWATGSAQQLSMTYSNAPLKTVLDDVTNQSGYRLWLNDRLLEQSKAVSINVKDAPLKEVLDKCFEHQPLTYEITNKTIVIKLKPISLKDKFISLLKAIKITGTVKDEQGQSIAGVTVRIKGTNTVVLTNENGVFSIEVENSNSILQFSFIGFEMQERTASLNMQIILKEAVGQLDEVNLVSTGFETIPKERATGSFVKLNNELVERRVSTNILDRLEGVTSSLVMNRNYSAGNANSSPFSIRGMSTIFGNAKPLIVVDNFPFDGDITNLNPNDVESITVLKDATAASIWGARSGNGVIVITTKKGRQNKPLSISINSNVNLSEKPDIFYGQSFLDANGFIEAEQFLFSKGYFDANLNNTTTRPVVSPVVEILAQQRAGTLSQTEAESQINAFRGKDVRDDISRYFYRSTASQQYALNLSAGGDKYSYYISSGYDNVPSVNTGNDYNRTSMNSNFNFTPIKNLEITTGLQYALTNSQNNSIQGAIAPTGKSNYYPYADLVDDSGNALAVPNDYRQSYITSLGTTQLLDWEYRPYDEIRNNDNTTKTNYARINAGLKYTFIPGFSLDLKYQLEKQNNTNLNLQNQQSYFTRNLINLNTQVNGSTVTRPVPLGDILDNDRSELTGKSFRAQFNLNKIVVENHELTAIIGIDARELIVDRYLNRAYGYNPNIATLATIDFNTSFTKYSDLQFPGTIPYFSRIDKSTDEYFSYFGNASYSYMKRYTFSGSARIDQSNLFGVNTNQKSIPLWSFGMAWDISSESFYKFSNFPSLKLRGTYGYNGNVDKSVSAFTTGIFGNSLITNVPAVTIQNPPNPELRWEKIRLFNLGVDFVTKRKLLGGSIEYYTKKGTDLIGFAPVDPTTGVRQYKGNVANISGSGVDIDLQLSVGERVKWISNLLFSNAINKVTKYRDITTVSGLLQNADGYIEISITPVVGRPVFSLFSYRWAGLQGVDGAPQGYLNGEVSTDYATLSNSADVNTVQYEGSSRPTQFGSFRNSIAYKNLIVSVNVTYKLGYFFRRPALSYSTMASSYLGNSEFNNRWINSGDEFTTNVPSFSYPFNANRETFYQYASINIEKGDHFRLQDVQVKYDFKLSSTNLFRSFGVYAYINNLGIIWKQTKETIDPDFIRNDYISPRTYAIGLKATF